MEIGDREILFVMQTRHIAIMTTTNMMVMVMVTMMMMMIMIMMMMLMMMMTMTRMMMKMMMMMMTMMTMLICDHMNAILEKGIPTVWRTSILTPLYKGKGNVTECTNYRGIKLMCHGMKLYERLVEDRLRQVIDITFLAFVLFSL